MNVSEHMKNTFNLDSVLECDVDRYEVLLAESMSRSIDVHLIAKILIVVYMCCKYKQIDYIVHVTYSLRS